MTDVRRLVGIDAGVLDQNLPADVSSTLARMAGGRLSFARGQRFGGRVALQAGVDVSRAGDFKLLETLGQRKLSDNLFGNLARRFAQAFGQLEGERQSELAHLDVRRLIDDDDGQVDIVFRAQEGADVGGEDLLLFQVHEKPLFAFRCWLLAFSFRQSRFRVEHRFSGAYPIDS
jgi:hypothetical protein